MHGHMNVKFVYVTVWWSVFSDRPQKACKTLPWCAG